MRKNEGVRLRDFKIKNKLEKGKDKNYEHLGTENENERWLRLFREKHPKLTAEDMKRLTRETRERIRRHTK